MTVGYQNVAKRRKSNKTAENRALPQTTEKKIKNLKEIKIVQIKKKSFSPLMDVCNSGGFLNVRELSGTMPNLILFVLKQQFYYCGNRL